MSADITPDPESDAPETSRRRFLVAAAVVPVAAGAPFAIDALRDPPTTPRTDGLQLRVTSNDGRYQALGDPLPTGGSIYAPGGRARSTIAVSDQLTGSTRSITLDRNLEPEAFSPDGRTLFAIDHRPAEDPVAYRVSTIDIEDAIITDTLGPRKIGVTEEMRGTGRQQVWSPLGDQLYTLYIRQFHDHSFIAPGAPSHDHSESQTAAFVHVLDVATDWALCVALPDGFGLGPADSTAIMIDDTGLVITAVDRALGSMVEVTRLPDIDDETGRFTVSDFMPTPK
jgi:hypothetical protein